ncbi:cytochrome c peroxidase [Pseudidiomarina indica]|uniref:Cytochrome c peroxidase n=1 Tax=Pseudidiomarina indica TaxID=1159017 RepID=A0A1G6A3D6_9GAMM|nr:cytochrome c peroxidase [Pseudidiomarina indica]SDB02726.1 cytochrome c peroxidase [Pseudidiomarina indica]
MVKQSRSFVVAVVVFCVAAAASVQGAQNVAESTVSQAYLQPVSDWPALHPNAAGELAALPEPLPVDETLVRIGERLFHDPKLSKDGTISCASCHKSNHHFADNVRISPGVAGKEGRRTAQMLRLVGHWDKLFWDGRVSQLKELVEQPLTDPVEMASSIEHVMAYVMAKPGYHDALADYFKEDLQWEQVASAIAEYIMSLDAPMRRFDYFMQAIAAGDMAQAANYLSEEERWGMHLFRTKAGCVQCHAGPLFSDQQLHNIGLAYYGRHFEDLGHYRVSGQAEHVGAFRTPSLRYVSERPHLMHNGLFNDLNGIVRMYRHGGPRPRPKGDQVNDPLFPETSPLLVPFELSQEEENAIVSFLKTL